MKKKNCNKENNKNTELEEKIKLLEEKIKNSEKEYLVKLAELDNSRKRMDNELKKQKDFANEKIIVKFLEILDNLELALKSEGDIKEGINMIINQFNNMLSNEGVEVINEKEFNPEFHNAVSIEEGSEDGIEEIRKGYVLKGRVIRPSLVKIFKKEA